MNKLKKYYLILIIVTIIISFYPLYMGAVILINLINGGLEITDYPKYVIPYTPIAIALIVAIAFMPLINKKTKKYSLLVASIIAILVFFGFELLLENQVVVGDNLRASLENWQMYMCYIPPSDYLTRPWTEVNVLMGEYSPAFKIHFYIISVLIILSLLNSSYGFGKMIESEDRSRQKALTIQTISSFVFVGLCILACFTAFFRNGDIQVSPLSAALMIFFFVTMGVTSGIYLGSFLLNKKKMYSLWLPMIVAMIITLIMYIGEMVLLSGHLYRFGYSFFFRELDYLVFAPIDICVIILSGLISICIMKNLLKTKI